MRIFENLLVEKTSGRKEEKRYFRVKKT